MPSRRFEGLLTLVVLACLLLCLPSVAWAQSPAEPDLASPPALTLTEPTLAQRSLAGPVAELVVGSVVVVSAGGIRASC